MAGQNSAFATRVIHAGENRADFLGAITLPIFQSSIYDERWSGGGGLRYLRRSNSPNHDVLGAKLAALEGAEDAVVTASGMAAIATSLLTILQPGDHLLVQERIYGGTQGFLSDELRGLGIEFDFVDAGNPECWKGKLRPSTRAFYVESLSNPLNRIGELDAVAAFAREHDLVSLIDNTMASPVNFRPQEHGFDLSLHSATKYLNGHSDLVAGAIIGDSKLLRRIRKRLSRLGGCLDPHACFLLHRGIKTLALRVRQQNASALTLARFLDSHESVSVVHYAGLEQHPDHARGSRLLDGFGGVVSFEIASATAGPRDSTGAVPNAATAFIGRTQLPARAPSLGGVESLITRPVDTSHSELSPQELAAAGISPNLVRISVGIEAVDDLIDDLRQALAGPPDGSTR